MILMTGEQLSQEIKNNLKAEIKGYMIKPCLALIQVGENEIVNNEVAAKIKACNEIGIYLKHIVFDTETKEIEIINKIIELNNDDYVNGISLQFPFPEKYNIERLINYIARNKDVDGLTDLSVGKLFNNKKTFVPCTAGAIMALCRQYEIPLEGKNVVVTSSNALFGKQIISLLLEQEAVVTLCHKKDNLKQIINNADILITQFNDKEIITEDMIKKNTIIFDAGLTNENGKAYGDISFDNIKEKASYMANLQDGIATVAVVILFNNVMDAYRKMNNVEK